MVNTNKSGTYITRFAPSPTGLLHKGHAYSALLAYKAAQRNDGNFLLRIEDIDTTRCKPEFIATIYEDLAWLGLTWEQPVRFQSQHFPDFQATLSKLLSGGLAYPCFCTRKDILAEIAASKSAPHGPEGPIYPGTCKKLSEAVRQEKIRSGLPHAWRLDLNAALAQISSPLIWHDEIAGEMLATPEILGDIVLARKDTPTSYHLSVVTDDALQGITHIVRGKDLFHTTHIHVVLQRILGLPTPIYHHHKLLVDDAGVRFAKRNKSVTLQSLREQGTEMAALLQSLEI
ncbi:MAG: tRNA glutamyl-Q(34) synthetase GluQRS [Kordiimonas sp.]